RPVNAAVAAGVIGGGSESLQSATGRLGGGPVSVSPTAVGGNVVLTAPAYVTRTRERREKHDPAYVRNTSSPKRCGTPHLCRCRATRETPRSRRENVAPATVNRAARARRAPRSTAARRRPCRA